MCVIETINCFVDQLSKNIAYTPEHLKYCTQINEYWLDKNTCLNIVICCSNFLWFRAISIYLYSTSMQIIISPYNSVHKHTYIIFTPLMMGMIHELGNLQFKYRIKLYNLQFSEHFQLLFDNSKVNKRQTKNGGSGAR